jgi:hypothetical protein
MSNTNVTRRISIYVNGKEVQNSLKGVEGAIVHTKNALRKLVEGEEDYEKKSQELKNTLVQLKERQSQYREELGLTSNELKKTGEMADGLRGSLTGIWDSLVSGDLQGAKEGLKELKEGMGGLLKSTFAFITSPIGIAISSLAGFVLGAKYLFDFNREAEKAAQLIENLSGKTGQVVEDIRIKMQALVDTFQVGFNELAGAVDNLVDTGVAKDEFEALEKIKNGLLTAPDKNEFIASLESSSVTAKQVGLSLEEVISLKKSIEETGVNPEATFGALEKAGKNLALQTDNLRKNMTDAFGAAFTDDVLAKVKTGQITTVQALDLINKKSKEVNLNQTQQAELGAQLFGKAAQSAGGYATVLDTVSNGLEKQNEKLNGNQKALKELSDANEKFQKAQSELFRIKDFGELWTKIKASAIDSLAGIIEWVSDLKNDIQPLIDLIGIVLVNSWQSIKAVVMSVFDVVGGVVKLFFDNIKFGIEIIKKLFSGDFKGAWQLVKDAFLNLGTTVSNVFGRIKNTILDSLQSIVKNMAPILEALGMDVDKISKKLESWKSKEIKVTTSTESSGGENPEKKNTKELSEELAKQQAIREEARKKEEEKRRTALEKARQEREKAAKEELDKIKALADAKTRLAKAELDYYISSNLSKLKSGEALTQALVDQEIKRLSEINFRKDNELADDRLRAIAKAEETAKSESELMVLKQAIDLEYLTKKQQLDLEFQQQTDALKKQYEDEQKALRLEQLALDNELALAEADGKFEADRIKEDQRFNDEITRYKLLLSQKKITQEEYNRFETQAKEQHAQIQAQIELNKAQTVLGALGTVADALVAVFGQSKEMAIVQANISGAQAVLSIWAAQPSLPQPYDSIMKGVLTAAVVLQTGAKIKDIQKQKAPKKPKFFYGGPTGSSASLGYDEFGPVTGYVHKNEYVIPEVMTQDPKYADTIGWLENNRQRKIKGYVDGGETSPGVVPTSNPNLVQDSSNLLVGAITMLIDILQRGINAKVFFGYEDVEKLEEMKNEINQSSENGNIS